MPFLRFMRNLNCFFWISMSATTFFWCCKADKMFHCELSICSCLTTTPMPYKIGIIPRRWRLCGWQAALPKRSIPFPEFLPEKAIHGCIDLLIIQDVQCFEMCPMLHCYSHVGVGWEGEGIGNEVVIPSPIKLNRIFHHFSLAPSRKRLHPRCYRHIISMGRHLQ